MLKFNKEEPKNEKRQCNYVSFGRYTYVIDLERLREISTKSDTQKSNEREITEIYNINEDNDDFELTQRVNREVNTAGNTQGDLIMSDYIKLFLVKLLDSEQTQKDFELDFSTTLVINTLLDCGVLKEIEQ